MPPALTAALLGFLLGLRHATDADHVVAVTAIVARERAFARAARIGAMWGVGHTLTLLAVGGAMVGFRLVIPPRVALALEFGVALMLILLGFSNLRGDAAGAEPVATPGGVRPATRSRFDDARPFLVGTMHGLAGSAAVAVLVLATIREPEWAIAYLAVFGIGTIAGMLVVTATLAAPIRYAGARVVRLRRGIRLAAGALSLAFGLVLAHDIVVAGGLFAAEPSWVPR